MKKQNQIILFIVLLAAGLLTVCLQLFVFESPDGILGFMLFSLSLCLISVSTIKLCKLSESVKNSVFGVLDLLFSIGIG